MSTGEVFILCCHHNGPDECVSAVEQIAHNRGNKDDYQLQQTIYNLQFFKDE